MEVIESLISPLGGFIGGIAITLTGVVVAALLRRREQARQEVAKWYQDGLGLVARVQEAGHRTTTYQHQIDYPKLEEKLEPLAEEIQEHAGSAPTGVDEAARIELAYLAAFCSGILTLVERADELTTAEFFKQIQHHARQNYSGKHDMEDVNELTDSFDAYSLVDDLPSHVKVDEDALDEFADHFSDESIEEGQPTTIDEALGMPLDKIEDVFIDERDMDRLLGDSIVEYVRTVLIGYSEDVFERMEERKKRVS